MPKERPVNNSDQDEAFFAAHPIGEMLASIAERRGINTWNVSEACERMRKPIKLTRAAQNLLISESSSPLFRSFRASQRRHSGNDDSDDGALFLAIEAHGDALFEIALSTKTIAKIITWLEGERNA